MKKTLQVGFTSGNYTVVDQTITFNYNYGHGTGRVNRAYTGTSYTANETMSGTLSGQMERRFHLDRNFYRL